MLKWVQLKHIETTCLGISVLWDGWPYPNIFFGFYSHCSIPYGDIPWSCNSIYATNHICQQQSARWAAVTVFFFTSSSASLPWFPCRKTPLPWFSIKYVCKYNRGRPLCSIMYVCKCNRTQTCKPHSIPPHPKKCKHASPVFGLEA